MPMIFRHYARVELDAAVLLGALLSIGEACLEARCAELSLAIERLGMVNKHDALLLLRCSMSSPKLLYTLGCCPCVGSALLDKYDAILRKGLISILNIDMTDVQWTQASLPIKLGVWESEGLPHLHYLPSWRWLQAPG